MPQHFLQRLTSLGDNGRTSEKLLVATWNVAAVNNNPFEYWVTHPDPAYNMLMEGVQDFIDNPGHRDVMISEVFEPAMAEQLFRDMRHHGIVYVDEVERLWHKDFKSRSIISGFLKDSNLGKKRLASMPDRITNTVHTDSGGLVFRPTVINYFEGDLSTMSKWWELWRKFMFMTEVQLCDSNRIGPIVIVDMLDPINAVKYPALTAEEERVSVPLQILCLAIFDSILVHMLNHIGTETWQGIRTSLASAFLLNKDRQVASIILDTYGGDNDVVFIQEAAGAFIFGEGGQRIAQHYELLQPKRVDAKRDQNCLVLIRKRFFRTDSVVEVTDEVLECAHERDSKKRQVYKPGDLAAFTAVGHSGHLFLLASFHGDTNGLASICIVDALQEVAASRYAGHTLLFGLDANTYKIHSKDYQGVKEFQNFLESCNLETCWGPYPDPLRPTTCNARTYLQPQLNKAIRRDERLSKADKNLKDWILFRGGCYSIICVDTTRDNTGAKQYIENLIFPTTQFPSDHALVVTELEMEPIT